MHESGTIFCHLVFFCVQWSYETCQNSSVNEGLVWWCNVVENEWCGVQNHDLIVHQLIIGFNIWFAWPGRGELDSSGHFRTSTPLINLLQWQTCTTVPNLLTSINLDRFPRFFSEIGWQNVAPLSGMSLEKQPSLLLWHHLACWHGAASCGAFLTSVTMLSVYTVIRRCLEFRSQV